MRTITATAGLSLLAFALTPDACAAQGIRRPTVTSQRMTNAILENFRQGDDRAAAPKAAASGNETLAGVDPEKVVLPTMHITARRLPKESEVIVTPPPERVLGTGVKEYRNGAIKVRSIFFIPVCIRFEW